MRYALPQRPHVMKLIRLVVSDLHLGTGIRPGELNVLEDFHYDDAFAELLAHYDAEVEDGEIELILNGDIFDLLKVKVGGVWPTEITDEVATDKLRQCLDGHPRFVHALKAFLAKERRRVVFLPGNHDLDMWFPGPQELFRRYVAPSAPERVHFVTSSDTYYLPEGIQVRHGHQLERIHRVDYTQMTRKRRDGTEILDLPWGSLWILEVMNPAKEQRSYVDRVQPLSRFLLAALLFDTRFVISFIWRSFLYFVRRRLLNLGAWRERLKWLPKLLREEIVALGGFDEVAVRALKKMRGVQYLIVGHSHGPRFRQVPSNKVLINTGTWMRMINLDIRHLGQDSGLTYCRIEYSEDGRPTVNLLRWHGERRPYEIIPYAD
jgi:UDP-2,3-diacylglucosamine pyrophosphatase LpxH